MILFNLPVESKAILPVSTSVLVYLLPFLSRDRYRQEQVGTIVLDCIVDFLYYE